MHDLCVWITRIAYLQECICRSIIPKKYIPPWKSKTKPKNDLWDDPCKGFQILPWGRVWSAWTSSVLDLKFNSIRTSNSRVSICWFFFDARATYLRHHKFWHASARACGHSAHSAGCGMQSSTEGAAKQWAVALKVDVGWCEAKWNELKIWRRRKTR